MSKLFLLYLCWKVNIVPYGPQQWFDQGIQFAMHKNQSSILKRNLNSLMILLIMIN